MRRGAEVGTVVGDASGPVALGRPRPEPGLDDVLPTGVSSVEVRSPPDPTAVTTLPPARWKRWAAPSLSALIPGTGQMLSGRPGRGLALFGAALGLTAGTVALWARRDRTDDPPGRAIARQVSRSVLTTGLGMLWVGQILDAHALGRGRGARPVRDYDVALGFSRFSTVGLRAGQPSHATYDDWSFSVMAQVVPRVELGVADLSVKLGDRPGGFVVQAGPRATWRFFDRETVWLTLGGGVLMQGASSPKPGRTLRDGREGGVDRAFGAVPYAQMGAEWFLLDRWTLGLAPRVSLPVTDRFYGRGQKIPRLATTFELGASVGVRL
jgi:hypothetical protein